MFLRSFKSLVSRSESREDLDAANDERNLSCLKKECPEVREKTHRCIFDFSPFYVARLKVDEHASKQLLTPTKKIV